PETVLGAASCVGDELYFGARDGRVHCLGLDGKRRRSWNAREPIVASVAAGRELVYAVTVAGHLHALRRTDFEPIWEASLRAPGGGDGGVAHFLSSPAVARGRVYVGSAQRGLCCLGERGPAPLEHWSRGNTGGAVDERLLPERGAFAGELPAVDEWFDVDLPTSQARGTREQTKWGAHPLAACSTHLVTAVAERLQTHLVGWSLVEADRRESAAAAKHVWHMDMPGRLTIPPTIAGRQILIALATPDYPDSPGRIGAVSLDTGRPDWLEPLEDVPLEVASDDQHAYVMTTRGIAAFVLGPTSRRVWRRLLPRAQAVNTLLANDLLFAVRDGVLQVFDTATGVMLSTESESVPGLRLIGVDDQDVLLSMSNGIERRRIVDGARVWRCDVSVKGTPVLSKSFIAVSTMAGELAVVDLKTGSELQKLSVAVESIPPLVTGDRIYLATPRGFDHCTVGGEMQRWCELSPEQLPVTPLVAARGRLYYLSKSKRLACVSGPTP
ncbi:MAG TPA: PQQ-binding-like beta-propeller repeat protein, partial [Pirellulaceae bacterium]|nr:PQQ-binding-like beta-propeller repeat protein [Pirellulaceae bacterium]